MYIDQHRNLVSNVLKCVVSDLLRRAMMHDSSKFSDEEQLLLNNHRVDITDPNYSEVLRQLAEVLKHHYANNDHHPEHFKDGIVGMNLIQLVEMVADWQSCCKMNGTNIEEMLKIQKIRFNISEDLLNIIRNTFKALDSL